MNLSSCDHCGSRNAIVVGFGGDTLERTSWVECQECRARGPIATEKAALEARGTHRTLEDYAVALWNRRHIDRRRI